MWLPSRHFALNWKPYVVLGAKPVTVVTKEWGSVMVTDGPLVWVQVMSASPDDGGSPAYVPYNVIVPVKQIVCGIPAFTVQFCAEACSVKNDIKIKPRRKSPRRLLPVLVFCAEEEGKSFFILFLLLIKINPPEEFELQFAIT
jgi:hypothetical protein